VYDRLREEEAIQYLLVNRSSGFTIDAIESAESTTYPPDSDLHSLAAVTDRRVLFLTGQADSDRTVSLNAGEITGANVKSGLLSTTVHIETETEMYAFPVRKRDSSDPAAAVTYIQEHLVPSQSVAQSNGATQGDVAANEQGNDDSQQTGPNGDSAFVTDEQQLAVKTRDRFRTARKHISTVDTTEDNLGETIESLETAKEEFESIAHAPGINSEKVNEAVERLESLLEPLHQIRAAISEGNRKLTLVNESTQVRREPLKDTLSTIDEAIDTAERLGRTPTRLQKLREQIEAELESATEQSGADTDTTEAPDGQEQEQKPDTAEPTRSDATARELGDQTTGSLAKEGDNAAGHSIPAHSADEANTTATGDGSTGAGGDDAHATGLKSISSVNTEKAEILAEAGYDSIDAVRSASYRELTNIDGISNLLGVRIQNDLDMLKTSDDSTSEQTGDDSTSEQTPQEEIINEVEKIAKELSKRPTMTEFNEHSQYDSSNVYDHFDAWDDAIEAAEIPVDVREKLIDELHQLKSELGFIPRSSHLDERSQFSAHDYQQEFDSFDEALQEAGFDLEAQVTETIEEVVEEAEDDPYLSDFEELSPYSSGAVYKFFDSWDAAISAVSDDGSGSSVQAKPPTTDKKESSTTDPSTARQIKDIDPEQNELSERYELIRNLRKLCELVIETRAETENEGDMTDPMKTWEDRVAKFHAGDSIDRDSYGTQQAELNSFSMAEYRSVFGTGQRTTEFEHVQTRPLTPTVQALLAPHTDEDLETYHLPVDTKAGARFPVIVESQAELERATEMSNRLPSHPNPAAIDKDESGQDETKQDEDGTEKTGHQPGTDRSSNCTSKKSGSELTEIHGITDSIAQSLQHAGYQTRDDLQDASVDDLAAVDGVGEQVAMRIIINVGG